MSDKVGFVTVAAANGQGPLLPGAEPVSEATQKLVDAEVRRIVEHEQEETRKLVVANRERLDALAAALLEARDARRGRGLRGGRHRARAGARRGLRRRLVPIGSRGAA